MSTIILRSYAKLQAFFLLLTMFLQLSPKQKGKEGFFSTLLTCDNATHQMLPAFFFMCN
jgi:hypothetical protein